MTFELEVNLNLRVARGRGRDKKTASEISAFNKQMNTRMEKSIPWCSEAIFTLVKKVRERYFGM